MLHSMLHSIQHSVLHTLYSIMPTRPLYLASVLIHPTEIGATENIGQ